MSYSVAGYKFMFDDKLVTVWSAPNYCYRCGNVASILALNEDKSRQPKLFHAVPDTERVIPPYTTTPYFLWLKNIGRENLKTLKEFNKINNPHLSLVEFLDSVECPVNFLIATFKYSTTVSS